MRPKGIRRAAAGVALGLCAVAAHAQSPQFVEDCRVLTAFPERVTGSEGGARAADYIGARLAAMRPDLVMTQTFAAVRERTLRCELRLDSPAGGSVLRLHPLQANGAIPPVTAAEGIAGPLVVLGDGSATELLDRNLQGSIVVLDYNCGEGWLRAFRLGARAVLFVRRGPLAACNANSSHANVNLPRFFYDGPASDLPDGAAATVVSEVVWEPVQGRNVLALLKGTAPVFSQEREELVVLAASFDSYGTVPDLACGARGAANVAALLQIADGISRQRARRHVLIAAFDAQALLHLGSRRFYTALESDKAEVTVKARRESLEAETAFVENLLKLLAAPRPLDASASAVRRELLSRLRDRAAQHAYEVADQLLDLRAARGPNRPDAEARARLEAEEDEWNRLRRALGRDETAGLEPALAARLEQVAREVREAAELRREELARGRGEVQAAEQIQAAIGKHWIALHASLLLGDYSTRWRLAIGGDSSLRSPEDKPGVYGKVQDVFLRADRELAARGNRPTLFERDTANQALAAPGVIWGGQGLLHSGEPAGLFGIYNVALATCQESAEREGTPDDTLAALDLGRIEEQARDVARVLAAVADLPLEPDGAPPVAAAPPASGVSVADQESLSLRRGIPINKEYAWPRFVGGSPAGAMVMGRQGGSPIANVPVPGAIVHVRIREPRALSYDPRKKAGFRDWVLARTDGNGAYEIGPVSGHFWWLLRGVAFAFDGGGRVRAAADQESYPAVRQRLNLFECRPGWMALPPTWTTAAPQSLFVRVLSGMDSGELGPRKSYRELWDGVLAWYADPREDRVKISGLPVLMELNTGAETHSPGGRAEDPDGAGFPMRPAWEPPPGARRAATDLWRLNDTRLETLRSKNIMDSSLAELHGRSEDLLLASSPLSVTLRSEALDAASFMSSQPVYVLLRSMIDDLVFAVLILLGLAVPFSFAMERIVIGSATIGRQLAWFAGFFAATFLVLFFTHPAFAIATTPVIIFLGFAVVVLSGMVIVMLMRRFETELKALQGMRATIHSDDVSRFGTLMAAVQMGISTMRRRPMRTALTAVTITLLTFTILSFASFGTQTGVVRMHVGPVPAYRGIFVRHVNWRPLASEILDVIRGRWSGEAAIYARRWISPRDRDEAGLLLSRDDATSGQVIRGVAGFDPGEIALRPDLARLFDRELEGKVLLPQPVARALAVKPGDAVRLAGLRLRVGNFLDGPGLAAAVDMENSGILPVDFTEVRASRMPTTDPLGGERESPVGWTTLPADSIVVVSDVTARRLGAQLQAVALYPAPPEGIERIAADLARMVPLPVAATGENGVYRSVLGTVVAASGAGDLLFPLLLGGLVVFGTMLGSVADREREIYTFSALGLAPRHVATLFLAESVIYSVIGGMGGYLLANGVLRALNFAAARGWAVVPEMNMSSTNTIATILIVMGTVLASAVYPALRASRSANPGLLRTWRPPAPQGDVLDMVFPFTVSAYDITGIVSFLREHFDSHNDTGLGRFMARDTSLQRGPGAMLALRADVSLAPFDLGVTQSFHLSSAPSPIPGIDEVRIRLERRAGQPKDWVRLNRGFLDNLRQQFLIWRSLPEATMEVYRARTLAAMGRPADAQD